jgi:hypothetical protein
MKYTSSTVQILSFVCVLGGLGLYNFLGAQTWTAPTASAPLNNVRAPINVGSSLMTMQNGSGTVQFDFLAARDTVLARTEMRSPKYCDLNGENCISNNKPTPYNFEVQTFSISAVRAANRTIPMGHWSYCALSRDFNDFCRVTENNSFWSLEGQRNGGETLSCEATCFYTGNDRMTEMVDPNTYEWRPGPWNRDALTGVQCFAALSGGGPTTRERSVQCWRTSGRETRVQDSLCARASKPAAKETCRVSDPFLPFPVGGF